MKFSRSLLAIVAALAPVACHSKKENASESLPPVAVPTVVVESKARPSSEEVVGTVRAKLRAAIEPKVSARIEALLVAPGQMVKTGDLIAQLDPRETQAKLDQALALREQTTRDLARSRELLDKKITTQADFDAVQARARVAEGAAREMETMLGYTKVVAPFDGIVTRKLADVGDLAAPGKPIIEMEDPRALRFEADVPETLIGHIKIGDKLSVQVAEGAAPTEGTVVEVAPVADAASRTFLVKLDLPAAEVTRSGQFGRVWVRTGESKSIRVPMLAIAVRGQMECVFVIANQHAQLRIVRTGKRTGGDAEILSGLNSGERVISEGAESLRDGQPVTLKQ
jgi:RND family efflux transporter MFP subunit